MKFVFMLNKQPIICGQCLGGSLGSHHTIQADLTFCPNVESKNASQRSNQQTVKRMGCWITGAWFNANEMVAPPPPPPPPPLKSIALRSRKS
ncbi:hypothetical protein IGI04_019273 [Brassica rapa subsp. trilocularis]|uniref:Uncharacterized protein n=1 Tax=Brassica rapa subsp. trilocularis TaxID=1813537 RepID=A0ABQ7MFC1_BRACM|nr:hypothetical protein IGI04_019273 [Brassica rapa subsp. trilocularis]